MSELPVIFNFTILHSISRFCTGEIGLFTNLGLIDMFSTNQTVEIAARMLLVYKHNCISLHLSIQQQITSQRRITEWKQVTENLLKIDYYSR